MPRNNPTPQDAASLERLLKQIEGAETTIRLVLDDIKRFRIERLDVPNCTILFRALDDIDSFAAGAKRAVRKHRKESGEFQAATPEPETTTGPARAGRRR